MRSTCNQLLLYSHCISHRCQLELKKTGEKDCQLCKDVNQFLERLGKRIANYVRRSTSSWEERGKGLPTMKGGQPVLGKTGEKDCQLCKEVNQLFERLGKRIAIYVRRSTSSSKDLGKTIANYVRRSTSSSKDLGKTIANYVRRSTSSWKGQV